MGMRARDREVAKRSRNDNGRGGDLSPTRRDSVPVGKTMLCCREISQVVFTFVLTSET